MEMSIHLRHLETFLMKTLHLLMNVQLQVALFTNLIAQLHLLTQAMYGSRMRLAKVVKKSEGQEV